MDRRKFSISLVAAAVLAGCGGGGSDGPPVDTAPTPGGVTPELASATSLPASVVFAQSLPTTDGTRGVGPGQANYFDLGQDFSINDGSDDQFDGALQLAVEVGGTTVSFPSDQVYAELTALGPELDAADGVKTVTFTTDSDWVVNGTGSAVLHGVPGVRLEQTIDLTPALGQPVELTWAGNPMGGGGGGINDAPLYIRVVLRNTAGALLATLFYADNTGAMTGAWGQATLDAYTGQVVVLCFEQNLGAGVTVIDDVSVQDTANTIEYVTNGGFEAGGTGWRVPAVRVSQNVRSGVRTLPGTGTLQRTFYTQPDQAWGRMTDVFTNTSGSAVQARITYTSNLGSDGAGIIYRTPGTAGGALSSWDGSGGDRDVGFVFGAGATVNFQSATALNTYDGNDEIEVVFDVEVPAGRSITLVNFLVLTGANTGATAANTGVRATQVDAIAAEIAANFRTDAAYQRGLTQKQLDTLQNF